MNSVIEALKNNWALVSQFTLVVLGVLGIFILPPPTLWAEAGPNTVLDFGRFLVTIAMGLALVACFIYDRRRNLRGWVMLVVVSVALGAVAFLANVQLAARWTCVYLGESKVAGETLTPRGTSLAKANPQFSCTDLISAAIGRTDAVWVPSEILDRHLILVGLFLATMLMLSVSLISLLQAVKCTQSSR